jgi:uncharacterized protein YuzB (UPF0349 family)
MDEDDFINARRGDLAQRTAKLLADLSASPDIDTVERELHRIVGTCGTFGLVEGAQQAGELLHGIRSGGDPTVRDLSVELLALSIMFLDEGKSR